MNATQEHVVDLGDVVAKAGIALHVAAPDDLRLAYKANGTAENEGSSSSSSVRLVTFSRVDDLVETLKGCTAVGESPGTEVTVLGIVTEEIANALQALNISIKRMDYFDSLVRAQQYLTQHLPVDQLTVQNTFVEGDVKLIFAERDGFVDCLPLLNTLNDWATYADAVAPYKEFVLESSGQKEPKPEVTKPEVGESLRSSPCLLVDLESTVTFLRVSPEDEKYTLLDVKNNGLDMFVGMGSLLTGAKDYDELMSLAARGHPYHVHQTDRSMAKAAAAEEESKSGESKSGDEAVQKKEVKKDDAYSVMMDSTDAENVYFSFAQALGKNQGDFNAEDLAAALLYHTMMDINQILLIYLFSDRSIKHVVVSGSLLKHPLARQMFVQEYWRRMLFHATFSPNTPYVPYHILTHAPYYPAIGAMINKK